MNTAIQCIILLACTIICISAAPTRCMCVTTISALDPKRIASVAQYGLRPYCNKEEVIVTLKDGTKRCLDPKGKFTIKLLQLFQEWANRKMNTTGPGTTMSPGTATATATATAAATTVLPTSP